MTALIREAALSHIARDKTEAAYRRGDLFEKGDSASPIQLKPARTNG